TVTPLNTNINIQREVTLLYDIEQQDIIRWKKEFKDVSALCGWDNETACMVLDSIVASEYLHLVQNTSNIHDKLNNILQYKYPANKGYYYAEELARIKQDNFLTIEDYLKEVTKHCNRLGISKNYDDFQKHEKIEDSFYYGLSDITKLEMTRLNIHAYIEMYKVINDTEHNYRTIFKSESWVS
ncbi:hypothetical protein EDEG_03693, partial [Edhazardia aedis USNM 41457]